MPFVCNFPFFSIVLSMFCGIVSSVLSGKTAKKLSIGLLCVNLALSASVLAYTLGTGESYVYMMGHFPAPWGNETCCSRRCSRSFTRTTCSPLMYLWRSTPSPPAA